MRSPRLEAPRAVRRRHPGEVRRPSVVHVRSILGPLVLVAIAALQLVRQGQGLTVLLLIAAVPVIAVVSIALTRPSMARGRSVEEILDWWLNLPVVGPLFRFSDRLNHRMGRGTEDMIEDARYRRRRVQQNPTATDDADRSDPSGSV